MESLLITYSYVNILCVTELKNQACWLSQQLLCDTDMIVGPVSPSTYFLYVYLSKYTLLQFQWLP